jgi:putative aldouronate transport system substrate-binding protein
MFAGCNGNVADTTASPISSSAPSNRPDNSENETENPQSVYPIVEPGSLSLKIFWPLNQMTSAITTDLNELVAYQEMEKVTGIKMQYISPMMGQEETAFQLLLASQDLPDIMPGAERYYAGGSVKLFNDGFIMELTDLIEGYAPNCWASINADDQKLRNSKDDNGRFLGMPSLNTEGPEPAWGGILIRRDLLDEQGMSMPKTIADWDAALTMFRDVYGMSAPLFALTNNGYFQLNHDFSSAFDVTYTFIQINGEVKYGPAEYGWKEYVALMHDWYARGLFDNEFVTRSMPNDFFRMSLFADNIGGAGENAWGNAGDTLYKTRGLTDNPNFYLEATTSATRDENHKTHLRMSNIPMLGFTYFDAETKHIREAMAWLDYLYTPEGLWLNNYGIEGTTYNLVDGKPTLIAEFFDNSEESGEIVLARYSMYQAPGLYDYKRNWQLSDPELLAACDVWDSGDNDYMIVGNITMTDDEAARYASAMSEVETYMTEMTCKFIMGLASIDNEFDGYVARMKQMGLDDAVAVQQAAYDRFIAR